MPISESIIDIMMKSSLPVSGERMANDLSVSRTAVWKAVRNLKKKGFDIESKPGSGYMLHGVPDRMIPDLVLHELGTRIVGRRVIHFPVTDSTNTRAKVLAAQGEAEGIVFIAEEQTRGRGRLDRSWISPQGQNLLFSVLFRPLMTIERVFRLTMMASVALIEALEELTPLKPLIKWPNDVYVGIKKLAGILTEFSGNPDGIEYVVVGVGLNVNADFSCHPDIAESATSIRKEIGHPFPRLDLLRAILRNLDYYYCRTEDNDDSYLRDRWTSMSMILGTSVTVTSFDTMETGTAEAFDEDGSLILRTPDGKIRRIACGDVTLRVA
jgi:BirA family transcriptional regulator, biotin operon repressor / biotin---[acetyl-CoA-carboxylase] ligase